METGSTPDDRLLEAIASYGDAYQRELMPERCRRVNATVEDLADVSAVRALDFVFEVYAFARSGADAYRRPARDALAATASMDDDEIASDELWDAFERACEEAGFAGVNENRNRGPVAGLAELSTREGNLFAWVGRVLDETGRLEPAYDRLTELKGIGHKVSRVFLRDAVWVVSSEDDVPDDEAGYLQPVDQWVGAVASACWRTDADPTADRDEWVDRIANACLDAGVSNVAFNQGAWYWGTQVFSGTAGELDHRSLPTVAAGNPADPGGLRIETDTRERFREFRDENGFGSDDAALAALLDDATRVE